MEMDRAVAARYLSDVFSICNGDAGKSIVNVYVSLRDSDFLILHDQGERGGKGSEKERRKREIIL